MIAGRHPTNMHLRLLRSTSYLAATINSNSHRPWNHNKISPAPTSPILHGARYTTRAHIHYYFLKADMRDLGADHEAAPHPASDRQSRQAIISAASSASAHERGPDNFHFAANTYTAPYGAVMAHKRLLTDAACASCRDDAGAFDKLRSRRSTKTRKATPSLGLPGVSVGQPAVDNSSSTHDTIKTKHQCIDPLTNTSAGRAQWPQQLRSNILDAI